MAIKPYCCLVVLENLKDNDGECFVDGVIESLILRVEQPLLLPLVELLPPKVNFVGKLNGLLLLLFVEEDDKSADGVLFKRTFLLELEPIFPPLFRLFNVLIPILKSLNESLRDFLLIDPDLGDNTTSFDSLGFNKAA